MTTPYTGVAGNVSLGAACNANVPADNDPDNGATFSVGTQKVLDYLEALRQATVLISSGLPLNEGFENATFPPVNPPGAWAAPSVNFGSDLAYVRDTSGPITGTASANRPGAQTTGQNSSMSLTQYLLSPGRVAFLFNTLSNPNSDFLDFYIDGVRVMHLSGNTTTIAQAGRFVSDVLREGKHTFDWRFTRGGSGSVANEAAKIDTVEIIPESAWSDLANRWSFVDDFLLVAAAALTTDVNWAIANSGNAGSATELSASNAVGVVGIICSAVAIGDWEAATLQPIVSSNNGSKNPFVEARLVGGPALANAFLEIGLWDGTVNNYVALLYDSALGTSWRVKTVNGGTATTNDTGIVAAAPVRVGVSYAGNPALGVLVTINGQCVQAGATAFTSISNLPGGANVMPYMRVGSHTGAGARELDVDWIKLLALR